MVVSFCIFCSFELLWRISAIFEIKWVLQLFLPWFQIYLSFIAQSFSFLDSLKTEVTQRLLMGLLFSLLISWNAVYLHTESTVCAQVPFLEFDAGVWMTNGDLSIFQAVSLNQGWFESRLQVCFTVVFPILSDYDSWDNKTSIFILAMSVNSDYVNIWMHG